MIEDQYPPRPTIAIRVGVTGHRLSRLETDQIDRIKRQIDTILSEIESAVLTAHQRYSREYSEGDAKLFLVSPLADGADTLAAQVALEKNWRLLAPLPFVKSSYENDFSAEDLTELNKLLEQADAVTELDGQRKDEASEDRAYLQAGLVTVSQSDFVIAVWDGKEARGLGGTAMIKQEALAAGKRVIWVNSVEDRPAVFLGTEGEETLFSAEAVENEIEAIVAPPPSAETEHEFAGANTHALNAYQAFLTEKPARFNFGFFFSFWERLFAGESPFKVSLTHSMPASEIDQMRESTIAERMGRSPRDQSIFHDIIIPRFCWADHLAIHYGNLYRSSYFFNYIFAAIAVFVALADLVTPSDNKTLLIAVEAAVILTIWRVTVLGNRRRWHEKWIDYRQVAEELRQFRHMFLTAGRGPRGEDPTQGEGGDSAGWVEWYLNATRREVGLTSGAFDGAALKKIATTILDEEIRPQIDYHLKKAGRLHKIEHRLHHWGERAFFLTFLVCVYFLVVAGSAEVEGVLHDFAYEQKKSVKYWVTLLCAFLPALGAAFFGIRIQGEFGSTAERSHATAEQLKSIARNFESIANAHSPRLEILQLRVEEAARAMLLENMDWRLLYMSKPLNLPG